MKGEAPFYVDPEVLHLLGKTEDELLNMGTREFAELSFQKGVVWEVGNDGVAPGLTIRLRKRRSPMEGF